MSYHCCNLSLKNNKFIPVVVLTVVSTHHWISKFMFVWFWVSCKYEYFKWNYMKSIGLQFFCWFFLHLPVGSCLFLFLLLLLYFLCKKNMFRITYFERRSFFFLMGAQIFFWLNRNESNVAGEFEVFPSWGVWWLKVNYFFKWLTVTESVWWSLLWSHVLFRLSAKLRSSNT